MNLYTTEAADCFHCHPFEERFQFTTFSFMNNGLDKEGEFQDSGLGGIVANPNLIGAFKVPTLRNIAQTAPYMHDGRFATLQEVIDHYDMGAAFSDHRPFDEACWHRAQFECPRKRCLDCLFVDLNRYRVFKQSCLFGPLKIWGSDFIKQSIQRLSFDCI